MREESYVSIICLGHRLFINQGSMKNINDDEKKTYLLQNAILVDSVIDSKII